MDPSFARRFQGKMAAVQEDGGSQSSPMARARPSNLSNHGGGGGGAYASPGPPSHMSSLSGGSDMGTHTAVAAAATATAAPQPGYSSAGRPKNRRLQASSGVSRERPDGGIADGLSGDGNNGHNGHNGLASPGFPSASSPVRA